MRKVAKPKPTTPKPTTVARKRDMVGVRVSKARKQELEARAKLAGRSISGECELRIEQSFEHEGLLSQALSLRYGNPLAGALLAIAEAMSAAGAYARRHEDSIEDLRTWFNDPYAFEQAARACQGVLNSLRPEGVAAPRGKYADLPIGEAMASRVVTEIKAADIAATGGELQDAPGQIAKLLGATVVGRIQTGATI